jgi:ParB family chromosome partitioning protein
MRELQTIPMDMIDPPDHAHRTVMDEQGLIELANSMRSIGLINPIVVRQRGGRYEIIAGHRRYVAAQMIGWQNIEALVEETDDERTEAARAIENMQREDLSPLDEARAIARYMEMTGSTEHEVARRLGRSDWWVRRRLALLHVDERLAAAVHAGRIAASTAITLMRVTDVAHRHYLADYAERSGASQDIIEGWVTAWEAEQAAHPGAPPPAPAMPEPGEQIVVTMPCAACGAVHPHRELYIIRICEACADALAATKVER